MIKVVRSFFGGTIGEVPASYNAADTLKYIETNLVAGKEAKVRFLYKECSSGICRWQVKFIADPDGTWKPSAKPTGTGDFMQSASSNPVEKSYLYADRRAEPSRFRDDE